MALLLRLQPRRAHRRLQDRPRVHPGADRPGQPRRQPAAGHRPGRRRHDPADHGAAPARDRRLAQGQRRGHLRHALRRPRLPVDRRQAARAEVRRVHGEVQPHGPGRPDSPRTAWRSSRCSSPKKPDALYAITPGWPGKQLVLRDVKVPADATVTMLGRRRRRSRRKFDGTTLTITMPDLGPDAAALPPRLRLQDRPGGTAARGLTVPGV